jgi:hypothetical protein
MTVLIIFRVDAQLTRRELWSRLGGLGYRAAKVKKQFVLADFRLLPDASKRPSLRNHFSRHNPTNTSPDPGTLRTCNPDREFVHGAVAVHAGVHHHHDS